MKDPLRSNFRTKKLNLISAWLSHDALGGVERKRMRWDASLRKTNRVSILFRMPDCLFCPSRDVPLLSGTS